MALITNWRQGWRFWSVRLGAVAAGLLAFAVAAPDEVLQLWASLPPELRDHVPPEVVKWLGIAMLASSMVARFVKQQKLEQKQIPIEVENGKSDNTTSADD